MKTVGTRLALTAEIMDTVGFDRARRVESGMEWVQLRRKGIREAERGRAVGKVRRHLILNEPLESMKLRARTSLCLLGSVDPIEHACASCKEDLLMLVQS